MKHPLINLDEIPEEGIATVPFFGREVFVYKLDGKPKAAVNVCLHFGGQMQYDHDNCKFVCTWHKAEFSLDGERLKGPAPADSKLMFLSTRVEDGVLNYIWGE